MTQPALLHLPGVTPGTSQWKAETLQMVNWGGFHGYVSVPFAPGATLLTGGSGTGKSTLLDAYLAVMMPSDTPFNGASNDAATGRARGARQRNLLTYLRGKTDTARETGTGELRDQVLRGQDNATWGAVAITFVDDHGAPFTTLRIYYVPRGATTTADVSIKLATIDARLDLRELEPLRGSGFDKRTLGARWPTIDVHPTYSSFSARLFTRLGIGANGDGIKALRLLARIQTGQQIPTVDGLYKTMVLETPATYAAANKAVEHFGALEGAYNEMITAADKARTLARLPELWAEREDASTDERLIDTFGVQREGDTPLLVWRLRAESQLLEKAVADNRAERRSTALRLSKAQEEEGDLKLRVTEIREQQRKHGGDILERLEQEVERLDRAMTETTARRIRFDDRVKPLGLTVTTAEQFISAQVTAERFMAGFDDALAGLEAEQKRVREIAWPIGEQRKETGELITSLRGRRSLVPPRLHEARLAMARAAGLAEADLPFVAELIDIAPDQLPWRDAAEAALYSIARVLLIDERHYDRLSMAIDPLPIRGRYHFEGVELIEHVDVSGVPGHISGKLIYKDSPFSAWVARRLSQDGTDALCVDRPEQLRGHGLRITRSGQTRHGSRGAHGKNLSDPIIGFNNADRIGELEAQLADLDRQFGDLAREEARYRGNETLLRRQRDAHQHILDTDWTSIDVAAIKDQIDDRNATIDRILSSSDILATLAKDLGDAEHDLKEASADVIRASDRKDRLDVLHAELCERQDLVGDDLERIAGDGVVHLTNAQAEYLDIVYAEVAAVGDLNGLPTGIGRLRKRLDADARAARDRASSAEKALCEIFETYQARKEWFDPNRGTSIESYDAYRDDLARITANGLHTLRDEWRRRLADWSGQDLLPLHAAFDIAIEDIEERLVPVNDILADLPFGAHRDRLKILLRRLNSAEVIDFRRELKALSSGITDQLNDEQAEARFSRLRRFIARIRKPDGGIRAAVSRDVYLDVRKHVDITAVRLDATGREVATYAYLGDKSGGETQELVAFIVGAALRFQLGDEDRARPRFAPIFLDEGFVKSDSEFAGRAVNAWKGLGFQLIIGAPLDKVTALEPAMDLVLHVTKSGHGYSHITDLRPSDAIDASR